LFNILFVFIFVIFLQAMGDEMGDQQTQYVNAANRMSVVTLEMGDNQVAWTAQDDAAANDDSRDDQSENWATAQAASAVEVCQSEVVLA
jgi:hypothetical protein